MSRDSFASVGEPFEAALCGYGAADGRAAAADWVGVARKATQLKSRGRWRSVGKIFPSEALGSSLVPPGKASLASSGGRESPNFIAFAEFYKDWREEAREGNRELDYGGIPEALNLTGFRLGQLVGQNADFLNDPEFDEYGGLDPENKLFRNALFRLELVARPRIVAALMKHYGGQNAFFVALWNSNRQPRPPDYEEHREDHDQARDYTVAELCIWQPPYQETEDEILNDVTEGKMLLWTWLEQGAEPLTRY
jgi:hypothetical protein